MTGVGFSMDLLEWVANFRIFGVSRDWKWEDSRKKSGSCCLLNLTISSHWPHYIPPLETTFMTRFIRLWNSPQGVIFNFRCPCKNLIRIQLIASNLSWLVYFASLMEDELRRKTDTICITMRSRANFQSRHESGAFVGKSIFSLWTLACQTKVISYAVSVTKWFYRQIYFMASQNFMLFM